MLSAKEFMVGSLSNAAPGTLVLPRAVSDAPFFVGSGDQGPTAICLAGQYQYLFMRTEEARNWNGILIPSVHIEVDETSVVDSNRLGSVLGAVERVEDRLVVHAKPHHYLGMHAAVIAESGLLPAKANAIFAKWQIVLGEGRDKRVLFTVDSSVQAT